MDDLTRLYRQALAASIDALEAAKAAFLDDEPDALDSLRRLAHSLKGSGGTYGFPNITDAAATLEGAAGDEIVPGTEALLRILKEVTGAGGEERKFGLLIVEDDLISARIMQSKLAAANRVIHLSETAAHAKELLVAEDIHLVLLDLILPDTDGRNFLVWLREQPALAGLPVIITSAKGSAATKTECFALGADEFFEKPIDLEILASAVAAKMQRSGELARESRIDPLTKLPNRAALAEAFQRTQSQVQRSREPLSIAILDLDHFKAVNDTHGHAAGDEVLCRLGTTLTSALRGTDVVARWGGEEFVVLFPNAGIKGSTNALENARQAFRQVAFTGSDGKTFTVTFSAGIVEVPPGTDLADTLERADSLLYLAKEVGRDRILTPDTTAKPAQRKILLVEDDELVAKVVVHRLSRKGFEVLPFADGYQALMAAPELDVALCILDVKLPGLDGFELLQKLRRMAAFRTIPIIMLTSMGIEKDIERGFALGADDYIMKPFSALELLARIRRLIKS